MSDFVEKAKDAMGDLKDSEALNKAEDVAEEQAEKGGTVGGLADKADDAIDTVQGTKD
jgi:hypothetical protein